MRTPVVQRQRSSAYPTTTYPAPKLEPGLTLRLSQLASCCCCQSHISHQHGELHDSHSEGGPVMSITWDVTRHNCCTILLPFDVAPHMAWMQPETRQCERWAVYCTPSTCDWYTGQPYCTANSHFWLVTPALGSILMMLSAGNSKNLIFELDWNAPLVARAGVETWLSPDIII